MRSIDWTLRIRSAYIIIWFRQSIDTHSHRRTHNEKLFDRSVAVWLVYSNKDDCATSHFSFGRRYKIHSIALYTQCITIPFNVHLFYGSCHVQQRKLQKTRETKIRRETMNRNGITYTWNNLIPCKMDAFSIVCSMARERGTDIRSSHVRWDENGFISCVTASLYPAEP